MVLDLHERRKLRFHNNTATANRGDLGGCVHCADLVLVCSPACLLGGLTDKEHEMSIPDVAALIRLPRVPGVTGAMPSAVVSWALRLITVLVFLVATWAGVELALSAPHNPAPSPAGPAG
jgi:hypothetical protein